jgi:hypothetical protein
VGYGFPTFVINKARFTMINNYESLRLEMAENAAQWYSTCLAHGRFCDGYIEYRGYYIIQYTYCIFEVFQNKISKIKSQQTRKR